MRAALEHTALLQHGGTAELPCGVFLGCRSKPTSPSGGGIAGGSQPWATRPSEWRGYSSPNDFYSSPFTAALGICEDLAGSWAWLEKQLRREKNLVGQVKKELHKVT